MSKSKKSKTKPSAELSDAALNKAAGGAMMGYKPGNQENDGGITAGRGGDDVKTNSSLIGLLKTN